MRSLFPRTRAWLNAALSAISACLLAVFISSAALAPQPAQAAMQYSTALRTASMQTIVTTLGGSATARWYTGACSGVANAIGGTVLATLTFGSTNVLDANGGSAGNVTNGVLTFGGFTQTAASHVNGTPGCVRFSTSGGTAVLEVGVVTTPTAGSITFTGTIATGQNITGTLTLTAGNA